MPEGLLPEWLRPSRSPPAARADVVAAAGRVAAAHSDVHPVALAEPGPAAVDPDVARLVVLRLARAVRGAPAGLSPGDAAPARRRRPAPAGATSGLVAQFEQAAVERSTVGDPAAQDADGPQAGRSAGAQAALARVVPARQGALGHRLQARAMQPLPASAPRGRSGALSPSGGGSAEDRAPGRLLQNPREGGSTGGSSRDLSCSCAARTRSSRRC